MRQLIVGTMFAALFQSTSALATVNHVASKHDVDHTYRFLIVVNTLFFVGIFVAMASFIIKNRKSGLNLLWSMIPAIILLVIVGLGWTNFRDQHLGETFYAVKLSQ